MIRVLIVDDDKLARMGLQTMLPWSSYGMAVVGEAANGAKALEFIQANDVDLCFVDLMMPVMPGLEFIRLATELRPKLRFVVITFHEDFSLVQSALRLGVLDYISKLELEHADYDQIMRRLTAKLHEAGVEHQGDAEANPAWEADLLSRRWLYDREALDALCCAMGDEPAPLATVERLLVRVALQIEDGCKLAGPPVPQLSSQSQATAFLYRYRDALLSAALGAVDLSRLCTCLLRAVALVRSDLGGNLHTDHVAALVGLSRPYFSGCFSREVGVPFNAYVRRERALSAKKLLGAGQMSIGEVAAKVGYEDVRSFSKMFHEHVGETPSQWKLHQCACQTPDGAGV